MALVLGAQKEVLSQASSASKLTESMGHKPLCETRARPAFLYRRNISRGQLAVPFLLG